MFLNGFSDSEKNAFFSLARSIISADMSIAENEETLLDQFLQEMDMTAEQVVLLSFEKAIDTFSHSGVEINRQVYIELFALALCDADFATEEKELLATIANKLGISEGVQIDIQNCVMNLLRVYSRMNELIKE